jgi:hypothetical protein
MKFKGILQLLSYDNDGNLLGDKTDTVNKNTETLIDVSKEADLEINIEKTKYMLLSHHENCHSSNIREQQ